MEVMAYDSTKLYVDLNNLDHPLEYYIPAKFHWFIKREAMITITQQSSINDYIKIFKKVRNKIKKIFDNHPLLYTACLQRNLWKKSIMTFGYNSTTKGRVDGNVKYFEDESNVLADHDTILTIAKLVEDHFKWVTQPILTPGALKLKLISKIFAYSLKPSKVPEETKTSEKKSKTKHKNEGDPENFNDPNYLETHSKPSLQIKIDNEFLTHIIRPPMHEIEKLQTNSFKGTKRGYQVNISLKLYDSKGTPLLDYGKAEQIFPPNAVHSMDAYTIHVLHTIKKQTHAMYGIEKLTKIRYTATHDSFAFLDTLLAKSLLELAYLCTHKRNYITCLRDNPNYDLLRPILNRKYVFPKKKKKKYDLLNIEVPRAKIRRQLLIYQLDPLFVK
jgi:hypothetical protein